MRQSRYPTLVAGPPRWNSAPQGRLHHVAVRSPQTGNISLQTSAGSVAALRFRNPLRLSPLWAMGVWGRPWLRHTQKPFYAAPVSATQLLRVARLYVLGEVARPNGTSLLARRAQLLPRLRSLLSTSEKKQTPNIACLLAQRARNSHI